ncbi:hypothetical protein [Pseudomonas sp. zfem003]|uniref:hypothetical protein n=1 Tax=Pseudomonas sp. zfem003 TaxID=3078198 RepID=UPI0029283239|nr:hypothetical protein [Pseudomonas sp. zfem003]MDU9399846.1 hypothetical protein [Pseudomonas sp. zfem003]
MFGIPWNELLLPFACAVGAIFGSIAQAIVATIQIDGPPNKLGILEIAPPELAKIRGAWMSMRIFVGAVLGFVFGLYFVGSINETVGTFCKIWALSFVVGYAAPKIWAAQEQSLLKQVGVGHAGPNTPGPTPPSNESQGGRE